jgi:protein-tyrosine phosphatase
MKETRAILFVCTGNICRSPTAEGVLRHLARKESIELRIESAGLGDWHIGQPPDERTQHHARGRGYDLSAQRARQVTVRDFDDFDLILAMDRGHRRDLRARCPEPLRDRIRLMREFDKPAGELDVPDPYYSNEQAFVRVYEMLDRCCRNLLQDLTR